MNRYFVGAIIFACFWFVYNKSDEIGLNNSRDEDCRVIDHKFKKVKYLTGCDCTTKSSNSQSYNEQTCKPCSRNYYETRVHCQKGNKTLVLKLDLKFSDLKLTREKVQELWPIGSSIPLG